MKKWLVVLVVMLISSPIIVAMSSDSREFALGSRTFCVPERYDVLDQISSPLLDIIGADSGIYGGSFQVDIEPEEVKASIPDYKINHGSLPATFFINLRLAPEGEMKRIVSAQSHSDILTLSGQYENAFFEYDEENDFYRVNGLSGTPPLLIWHVLSKKPDVNAVLPPDLQDYYVAYCSRSGGHNGNSSTCNYLVNIEEYLVEITSTENNLQNLNSLTQFTKSKIDSWEKNCEL
jgi:hypothetical protein